MPLIPTVFVLALAARLAGQLALRAYNGPETWEYEEVANNLLAGQGYTYVKLGEVYVASQSSPLYILLTAGVYALTAHSQAAMLALQAILGAATAVLCAWLGRGIGSRRVGWLAGCLVAVDPGLVLYSTRLHSLTLDALALVGVVCACIALPRAPGAWRLVVTGALVGLCALTRATSLVLLPVLVVWLYRFRGVRVLGCGLLVFAALAVYAPWPVRNSLLLGQFVPSSSESTEWLWRGTNPAATGSSWTADGRLMLDVAPPEFQAQVRAASEAERIGLYRDAALEFVRQQPAQALGLFATKLWLFWSPGGNAGVAYPSQWLALYAVWYVPLLGLAVWGAWRGLREETARPAIALIVATCVVVSLSQAAFYVEGRHRLGVEPLLLILSAVGASEALALLVTSRPLQRRRLRST